MGMKAKCRNSHCAGSEYGRSYMVSVDISSQTLENVPGKICVLRMSFSHIIARSTKQVLGLENGVKKSFSRRM